MDAKEFRANLQRLQLSSEDFAEVFSCRTGDVEDWQSGRQPVPRRVARDLIGFVAMIEEAEAPQGHESRSQPRPHAFGWLRVTVPMALFVSGFLALRQADTGNDGTPLWGISNVMWFAVGGLLLVVGFLAPAMSSRCSACGSWLWVTWQHPAIKCPKCGTPRR